MIASVTDLSGDLTGVQRTWLDPSGLGKAPIDTPRRAMGHLLGNAVRFGRATVRRDGGRRGHRDHALAPLHPDDPADGGGALGRPSRRPPAPSGAAPALHRPRCRSRRPHARRRSGRPRASCRHRGACPRLRGWATSTRICEHSASARCERHCASSSRRRMSAFSTDDWAASTQHNYHHGARCGPLCLHQHGGTSMFEEIFFPRTAEIYRAAPLVEAAGTISSPSQGTRHLAKHLAEMRQ